MMAFLSLMLNLYEGALSFGRLPVMDWIFHAPPSGVEKLIRRSINPGWMIGPLKPIDNFMGNLFRADHPSDMSMKTGLVKIASMHKKLSWIPLCLILLFKWLWNSPADASVQPRSQIQGAVYEDADPWGAEDASAEDDQPRIPEPMVFDLMRPLGSHQGEFEANVLGLIPIASRGGANGDPDALGLPGNGLEWAPELEYALMDGLSLELELPFETTQVAAYKGGAQWTFGKAFGNRFIHGAQLIIEYERQPARWVPVLT